MHSSTARWFGVVGRADQPVLSRVRFAAAMAALLAEFNPYLDREHADPTADSVSYRQGTLWLSQVELADLISQIGSALVSKRDNSPTLARRPHQNEHHRVSHRAATTAHN